MSERITEVEHDGWVLDVRDAGPVDGEPVVLLHGFPETSSCWDAVAPLLHAAGLRTLALDQRGYAPRARPARRRDYTTDRLAADVVALADRVGRPVHLVGHDWGSVVAWAVAQGHPDRLRSLTAVSVPHPRAYLRALLGPQALRSWYLLMFNVPGLVERLARRERGPFDRALRGSGMTAADVARFRRELVEPDGGAPLHGGLMWYRALPLTDRGLSGRPVRVPTTMVWSDGDRFVGRDGVDRCGDHVEAPYELVVLQGVSHWVPTEAPGALADAVVDRVRR